MSLTDSDRQEIHRALIKLSQALDKAESDGGQPSTYSASNLERQAVVKLLAMLEHSQQPEGTMPDDQDQPVDGVPATTLQSDPKSEEVPQPAAAEHQLPELPEAPTSGPVAVAHPGEDAAPPEQTLPGADEASEPSPAALDAAGCDGSSDVPSPVTDVTAEAVMNIASSGAQSLEPRGFAVPQAKWPKPAEPKPPTDTTAPAKGLIAPSQPAQTSPPLKRAINLRNARVGERYEAMIAIEGLKEVHLVDDAATGLMVGAAGLVTGTPQKAGDYRLRFRGLLEGSHCEVTASLAIIPDPKSLWTSKPSNRSDPYWKEEQAFGYVADSDLLCVAASKRGRSHAKDGTFRDDDFGLSSGGAGGWKIAVVADGAGSAKYSRYGSALAVKTVLAELPTLLDQVVSPQLEALTDLHLQGNPDAGRQIKSQLLYRSLATVAFNAVKAIEEEALVKNESAAAYSTTLIIGVVRKVRDIWFIAGFAIGDGGMAVFDTTDRSLKTMSVPDSGEYAGQTRFITKSEFANYEDVERRLFFDIRQQFTAIALMTDGITDPKFPTDHAFADPSQWMNFWEQDLSPAVSFLRTNIELKSQFLEWMDFWSPGNHDDRTLAILVP